MVSKDNFVIGRGKQADVVIDHPELSRKHAEIKIENEEIWLKDLGTTNGSFINQTQINADVWVRIEYFDDIFLGRGEVVCLKLEAVEDTVNELEENQVLNFSPDKKEEVRETFKPLLKTQIKNTVQGQTALPVRQERHITTSEIEREIEDINSISNRMDLPELSEIELLQVKKLEIDAKVAAIQIKKEADENARLIIEQAEKEKEVLLAKLNEQLEDLEQNISKLQEEVDHKKNEIELITAEKESLHSDIESLQKQIRDSEFEIEEKEKEFQAQKNLIEIEKNKLLTEKEQLISEYEDKKSRQASHLSELSLEQSQLEAKNLGLKNQIEADLSFKSQLEQKINSLEDDKAKTRSEYEKLQERIDRLLDEKAELSNSLRELFVKKESLDLELFDAGHKLSQLNEDIDLRSVELREVNREIELKIQKGKEKIDEELGVFHREQITIINNDIEQRKNDIILLEKESKEKIENAESEIQDRVELALKEYESTLMLAKNKREEILKTAQERSEVLLEKARSESNDLIIAAQERASSLHETSLKELEALRSDLDSKIYGKKAELSEAEKKHRELKTQHSELLEKLQSDQKISQKKALLEREEIINSAKKEAESILFDAEKNVAEKLQVLERQKVELIERQERELFELKESELQNIKSAVVEEENNLNQLRGKALEQMAKEKQEAKSSIEQWKKQSVDDIALAIENLLSLKLSTLEGKQLEKKDLQVEVSNIRKLVKDSLQDGNKAQSSLLNSLKPYNSAGRGKSIRVMKKWGVLASIILLFCSSYLIFPAFYHGGFNYVSQIFEVEKSAQEMFSEDLKSQRENRPVFDPEMTPGFKATLTENILYTSEFAKIWSSKDFQREWGVEVDNLMIYSMRLKGEQVDKFLDTELRLVKELQNMRKSITPSKEKSKIKEMFTVEFKREEQIKSIFQSDENYEKLLKAREKFYSDFTKN